MAQPLTLYKLIVLYMLSKVDFPLTNAQISEFVLGMGYTTYFKLQQTISELLEAGFITEESARNRTFYHLEQEGRETLSYLKSRISPAIRRDIDNFLAEKRYDLKNETSVKTNCYRNSNMEYSVRCQIMENHLPLIDLTLTVPSKSEAETIMDNWTQKNQEVYALIMSHLL